jgi:hypothetical protein
MSCFRFLARCMLLSTCEYILPPLLFMFHALTAALFSSRSLPMCISSLSRLFGPHGRTRSPAPAFASALRFPASLRIPSHRPPCAVSHQSSASLLFAATAVEQAVVARRHRRG